MQEKFIITTGSTHPVLLTGSTTPSAPNWQYRTQFSCHSNNYVQQEDFHTSEWLPFYMTV